MSDPFSEGVKTTEAGDETHKQTGHESGDTSCAGSSLSTPVTSEEVARQTKRAFDPPTKQIERLVIYSENFFKRLQGVTKRLVVWYKDPDETPTIDLTWW